MKSSPFFLLIILFISAPLSLALDKNIDPNLPWDKACADGKIFYPAFSKDPKKQRTEFLEYQKDPDNEMLFFRAGAYYLKQRPSELEKFCTQALTKHPNWAAAHYYLGKSYQSSVDDEQAFAEYKQAISMKPCFGWALMDYSNLLFQTGHLEEAVRVADGGLKYCRNMKDPGSGDCGYYLMQNKGKALWALKKYNEAAATFEAASQFPTGRTDAMNRNELAEVYVELGQWPKVIEKSTEAMKLAPRAAAAYLFRAKAYAALNKNQQALDDVSFFISKHAVDPTTDIQNARLLRATLYERLGKSDLAKKERESVKSGLKDWYKDTYFSTPPKKK